MMNPLYVAVDATDVTRQKKVHADRVPYDSTVRELIEGLVDRMNLPRMDSNGRELVYHARSESGGRHLHASETVGDSVFPGDSITLQPDIHAGASAR